MRQSISPEQLATAQPDALVQGFLQSVRERNPAAAIARLGGFSENPSPKTADIHAHIIRCFESSEIMREWPWNLITDPRSILVPGVVKANDSGHQVTMLAIHPEALREEPQILVFQVTREENSLWQLRLPAFFEDGDVSEEDDSVLLFSQNQELLEALKKFVKEKRQSQPKDLYATAEAYAQYLTACLADHDFLRFWVAAVPEDISGKSPGVPAILWQSFQDGGSGSSLFALLASKQEKEFLLAILQSYSPSEGLKIKKLWLKERPDKLWTLLFDEPEEFPAELLAWCKTNEADWEKSHTHALTEKAQRISALANASLNIMEIRNSFQQWQKGMEAQNIRAVIPLCASFNDDTSILRMLRNLGRDIVHDTGKRSILQVHQSGRWGAVSGRLDFLKSDAKPAFPLHIFVATDVGPRILPQIDYRLVSDNTTRDYLNKNALRDLTKIVPEQAIAELQTIIDAHRKLVAEQPLIPAVTEPTANPESP
jgi:hypothetical protein